MEIERGAKDFQLELIGLKDYFVYIKIDEEEKGINKI